MSSFFSEVNLMKPSFIESLEFSNFRLRVSKLLRIFADHPAAKTFAVSHRFLHADCGHILKLDSPLFVTCLPSTSSHSGMKQLVFDFARKAVFLTGEATFQNAFIRQAIGLSVGGPSFLAAR